MKTVLEMAREAGWDDHHAEFDTRIERFAELVRADALAEQPAQRCPLCNYQHGHAIGCKKNPMDIALNKMAENARELGLDYDVKSDHRLMDMPAQRTWVSLTDEERDYIWHTVGNSDAHGDVDGWSGRDVMAAIEAKLKEKNSG